MSNAAPWASTPGNKFRQVARSTESPSTKLLAEGLTALTEALRELDAKLEKLEQVRSKHCRVTLSAAPHRHVHRQTECSPGRPVTTPPVVGRLAVSDSLN